MKKRKDGYYEKVYVYELNGEKKKKHFYYKDEFDLVEKVKAFEAELEEAKKIYFCRVAYDWQEEHYNEIEPGTQISYSAAFKRATEAFEGKEIRDISPYRHKAYFRPYGKRAVFRSIRPGTANCSESHFQVCNSERIYRLQPSVRRICPAQSAKIKKRYSVRFRN